MPATSVNKADIPTVAISVKILLTNMAHETRIFRNMMFGTGVRHPSRCRKA